MSRFNTDTNHPLIPNSQEYVIEKKYVSIHSEDRNITKYPNASDFEIELPQDYLNVQTVKLSSWYFPNKYENFCFENFNNYLTFSFDCLPTPDTPLQVAINLILDTFTNPYGTSDIFVAISPGNYTPTQMATELTNRFNEAVSVIVAKDLSGNLLTDFLAQGGYTEFVIVYNQVDDKIWLGNRSATFTICQNKKILCEYLKSFQCHASHTLPDTTTNGLPSYLGLGLCAVTSVANCPGVPVRFFYGDVFPGDNGVWLVPDASYNNSSVSFIQPMCKFNNGDNKYIYMEVDGLNSLDETSPYNYSKFTQQTSLTNGIVNSAFAKIPIAYKQTDWSYDIDSFKYFNPPAERIRRLKIKFRYHNNQLVNFCNLPFTFTLEFTMISSQLNRRLNATASYISLK